MTKLNRGTLTGGALAGALVLSGCAGGSSMVGVSVDKTLNNNTCMLNIEASVDLVVSGASVGIPAFMKQCARHQIVTLLLAADLSYNAKADAKMKAIALGIAGATDADIERILDDLVNPHKNKNNKDYFLSKDMQMLVRRNVLSYRDALKAEGAAEQREISKSEYAQLQRDKEEAERKLYIIIEKLEACSDENFKPFVNDISMAYPNSVIKFKNLNMAKFGIDTDNIDIVETESKLCAGNFMYVYAYQGSGENTTILRRDLFFEDKADSIFIVSHIQSEFAASSAFLELIEEREAEQKKNAELSRDININDVKRRVSMIHSIEQEQPVMEKSPAPVQEEIEVIEAEAPAPEKSVDDVVLASFDTEVTSKSVEPAPIQQVAPVKTASMMGTSGMFNKAAPKEVQNVEPQKSVAARFIGWVMN